MKGAANPMQLFGGGNTLYITLAILGLFSIMHVIAFLLHGKIALAISIVNISLHILAIFAFMMLKLSITEVALAYLISLFVHTLIHFLSHVKGSGEKKGGEDR